MLSVTTGRLQPDNKPKGTRTVVLHNLPELLECWLK